MSTQIASDDFAYADNADLAAASPNWTRLIGTLHGSSVKVVSGAVAGGYASGSSFCYWNADAFPDDQYSEGVLSQFTADNYVYLGVRAKFNGVMDEYYYAQFEGSRVYIFGFAEVFYYAGDHRKGLAFGLSPQLVAGSVCRFEAVANKLTAYVDGAPVIEVVDNALSSGAPGVGGWLSSANTRIGSWSGGAADHLPPEAPHPEVERAIGRPGRPSRTFRR